MDVELQEKSDWSKIRTTLNQSYNYDQEWEKAINLFNKRVQRKFFAPIQLIIDQKILKGEGFTIVTVQCALIEMFAAFRVGEIFNHRKNGASPLYEYKDSQNLFTNFLHSTSIFKDHFWQLDQNSKIELDKPFIASEFYKNVRCGLMHEARTKRNWHITAAPLSVKTKTDTEFLKTESGKIKIYRTVLHYRLLDYLKQYSDNLREDTKNGKLLRKYFARKLDHLFDFNPDQNFDWWIV